MMFSPCVRGTLRGKVRLWVDSRVWKSICQANIALPVAPLLPFLAGWRKSKSSLSICVGLMEKPPCRPPKEHILWSPFWQQWPNNGLSSPAGAAHLDSLYDWLCDKILREMKVYTFCMFSIFFFFDGRGLNRPARTLAAQWNPGILGTACVHCPGIINSSSAVVARP